MKNGYLLIENDGAIDFSYFHGLCDNVTAKFQQLCSEWEEKSNKLEEEHTDGEEDINMEDGNDYHPFAIL